MSHASSKPLSGADTAWLRMDSPTNLMVINAMIVTDNMEFEVFRRVIQNRFLHFPRFKSRPMLKAGVYTWEPDEYFDLDCHVKKVALPGRADKKELQNYLADQLSESLDNSRPLWQLHFVENYVDGNAIILRVHHSYADGLALISVFNSITDSGPNVAPFVGAQAPEIAVQAASNDAEESGSEGEMPRFRGRYQKMFESVMRAADKYIHMAVKVGEGSRSALQEKEILKEYAGDCMRAVGELAQLAAMPADPRRVLKGKLGVRKKCAWSEPVNFDQFHGIAKVVGCKINDLMLSCVAGALREELMAAGEEVDGKKIHVTVPVNIRPMDQVDMAARPDDLGNIFGTVFVPLPVGIDNPLERVYKIKHDMLALKQSLQPMLSYGMLHLTGTLPRQLQKTILEGFGNKTSAVLSNVPGPREARYIGGAKIREQMFWVPQTGDIGLGLSIISYGGQVQFGMVGDARLFPNPDRIVRRCVSQIELHRTDVVASYIEDLVQPNMAS